MGYHVLCQTPGVRMLGLMDSVEYDQFHFCIYSYILILCLYYVHINMFILCSFIFQEFPF